MVWLAIILSYVSVVENFIVLNGLIQANPLEPLLQLIVESSYIEI